MNNELVINEKFGIKSVVPDGLFKFEVISYKEFDTNRGEPCLLVKVRLDNELIYEFPLLLTIETAGRLCEFFVSIGVKTRGIPIKVSDTLPNIIGKFGYVMVKDGIPLKFFNFSDIEKGYNHA